MIVIVTQCFPPALGGMQSLMGGLATGLAGLGHAPVVLADGKRDPAEAAHDAALPVAVERFAGPRPWRRRRKARALERVLRAAGTAVVCTDSWKSAATALAAAERHGAPVVALAHGNDVLASPETAKGRRIARTLGRTARVIANSAYTRGLVERLGIAPERIAVVNPGAAPPGEPDPEAAERMAGRIAAAGPVLTTIGRLEPRKGQDQVIRCLGGLAAAHPGAVYCLGGDGPCRGDLEALARACGVAERVRFLGPVFDADKAALLARTDLFVMPVREDRAGRSVEGFGIAYLEAAFRGVPAVAGRAGGAADAVVDGETGVLCDGDDAADVARALDACLGDRERLARMGAAARARAEREFTWDAAARRYLACFPGA